MKQTVKVPSSNYNMTKISANGDNEISGTFTKFVAESFDAKFQIM
jgi:hypothetical protein